MAGAVAIPLCFPCSGCVAAKFDGKRSARRAPCVLVVLLLVAGPRSALSVHGEKGVGFSVAGIASQRSEVASVHLNAALAWTRMHEPGLFVGAILEGPHSWPVRPVAEVFTEHASGGPGINSALVGAIWRAREGLSFDIGLRKAHNGSEAVSELRLGLTWTCR